MDNFINNAFVNLLISQNDNLFDHITAVFLTTIVDNFSETYAGSNGTAQAKAVIFFVIVVAISLFQLYFTRRNEIER